MKKTINTCFNKCMYKNQGYIAVKNHGFYYAIVEVQFYINGQLEIYRSPSLERGKGTEIIVPSNARQITLTAYYSNGVEYKVICTKTFDDPETRCYILEGTVFNPSCREDVGYKQDMCNCKFNYKCW